MRRQLHAAVAAAVVAAVPALADTWPQHPVKVIVPYAPGGNADTIGRLTAQALSAQLGEQFVVENRAGAAGAIGAETVAKAPPDGYVLCVCSLSQMAPVPLTHKVAYDPLKDFVAVAEVGANGFVITVSPAVPTASLREFIDYVKRRPGQLNYASGGNGTLTQLSAVLFLKQAGLAMTHVPYKGGSQTITETMADHVQMYSASPSEVIPFAGTGKLRLLGISSDKRIPQLPDVPAIAEPYPGFHAVTWNGLFAPAGTPDAIVQRLAGAVAAAMKDRTFTGRLETLGIEPTASTPAEFAATVRADYALWRKVIEEAGITAD
ncbi:MAG: tripartite tricarboxylate transporter substrate binding protein [Alphaproteobacteria bacterium]|nr:tripartite tricarboxylate transporter substrate binding protein [Alphaproteobacteria bacterium]